MPTTTNNGWDIPADTDLVKNGALAIRTLGSAIDTTVGVYRAPGLVKLNTTSFSAVSSQAISNVFSSTYDNYKVELVITANSAGPNIQLRFRDSGGDVSTALYGYRVKNFSSLGSGSDGDVQGRTQTLALLTPQGLGDTYGTTLDIFSPNLASKTMGVNNGAVEAGNYYLGAFAYNATTQFTGLSIISSTGTITGKVSVYGYVL